MFMQTLRSPALSNAKETRCGESNRREVQALHFTETTKDTRPKLESVRAEQALAWAQWESAMEAAKQEATELQRQ